MSSIEEILKMRPDFVKELRIPVFSFEIQDSKQGQIINLTSGMVGTSVWKVVPSKRMANCYLMVHSSRFAKCGYAIRVYHVSFTGVEQGFSMQELDFQSAEDCGVEVTIEDEKPVTKAEALKILTEKPKKHIIRQREGNEYVTPCVETFSLLK